MYFEVGDVVEQYVFLEFGGYVGIQYWLVLVVEFFVFECVYYVLYFVVVVQCEGIGLVQLGEFYVVVVVDQCWLWIVVRVVYWLGDYLFEIQGQVGYCVLGIFQFGGVFVEGVLIVYGVVEEFYCYYVYQCEDGDGDQYFQQGEICLLCFGIVYQFFVRF